jgi:hypothetical protein
MASTRTRWWLGVAGAALVLAASGCSGSTGSKDTASSSGGGERAAGPAQQAPQDGAGMAVPPQQQGTQPNLVPQKYAPDERSIVYTGSITVRVSKVDEAALKAAAAATGAGGFVGSEDRTSEGNDSSAKLTLRVPSNKFTEVLDTLHGLGSEQSRQVSTEDVTQQVADVDARLANAQASVDRVRALMAKANTIGEITSLESELSRREGDLESYQAQKRKLDDLTTLSTITVVLLGPEAAATTPKRHETGFLAGLKAGWSAFVSSMQVVVTVVGALLPWLVALAIPGALIWWLLRRTRRNRPARAVPALAGVGPIAATPGGPVAPAPRGLVPATPAGPAAPTSGGPAAPTSGGPVVAEAPRPTGAAEQSPEAPR